MYTYEEALEESIKYFNGNKLAAEVFLGKYALRDNDNNLLEKSPVEMHWRIAGEFARIEKDKFEYPLSKEEIFEYLDGFAQIIPQGSPMFGIGNPYQYITLANCYVLSTPEDAYSSIHETDQQLTQISKRRGGVGIDISKLRPAGTPTTNSSRISTGIIPFMERYSNSIREVGQCIAKGQRVLTKKGLKYIENVSIKDYVWTQKGWIKVKKVFNNGIKECVLTTTKYGFRIKTTKSHIFKTLKNGVQNERLENLTIGDKLCLIPGSYTNKNYISLNTNVKIKKYGTNQSNRLKIHQLPSQLTENFAYLLGYMYGDGNIMQSKYNESKGFSLACSNDYPDIKIKLQKIIKEIFNIETKLTSGDGDLERILVHSKYIGEFLKQNQISKEKSQFIKMPEKIYDSPQSVQMAFISGYLDADGDINNKGGYRISSTSLQFLQSCQDILISNGIVSKIHQEKTNKWRICIVGAYAKQQFVKLATSLKTYNKILSSKRDCILTPFKANDFNIKYNQYNYCNNSQYFSTLCFDKLKNGGEPLNEILIQDKIVSIQPIGQHETYDLELESEHMFYCEGFYVHNSNRRGALMLTLSVHHPEVLEFCKIKNDRTKVTGANISLRLSDEFLKAVETDTEYEQRWPVEGTPKISKMVRARDVWNEIVKNAHAMAEPGILMWDNIIRESPADCYTNASPSYKTVSTNPCFSKNAPIIIKGVGLSTIERVKEGDYVWSETGWTQVLKKWSTGIKDVYKYTTNYFCNEINENCYFLGTRNHRIVNNKEKIEIYKSTHINCFQDTVVDTDIARNTYNEPSRIVKVEYIGEEEVFDIMVDNAPHTLWSGGCNVSNCAELPLCEHDSCRLMLVNLFSCVINPYTDKAKFDYVKLTHLAKITQRLMDDLVDLDLECIDKIIKKIKSDPEDKHVKSSELNLWKNIREKCEKGRRTGTGITALGDTLAALNIKYGSKESVVITEEIYNTLKLGAYESSVEMAEELGPFPIFDYELEKDNPFLRRIEKENKKLYERMKKGRRNIALLTTAPTGSVSLLSKLINRFGTSSGIEPVFQAEYVRRRKINPGDSAKVDFVDQNGDKWTEYPVYHAGLQEWMDLNPNKPVTDSPYSGACAEDLDWQFRIKLQGAAQKNVDHSISATLNLPENVSVEEVQTIYHDAWKEGLKGVTIYRKNCRTGVLVDNNQSNKTFDKIKKTTAPKRPKTLPCDVHHINVSGKKFMVFVGLLNGEPYEIMAYEGAYEGSKSGNIIKVKRGTYKAELGNITIDSIVDKCNPEEETVTRLVSTSLRHGADIGFVVHQLEKTGGSMMTFAKCLARTLKKYIKDGTAVSGEECPNCSGKLTRQEGCVRCVNCDFSKCG